MAFRPVTFAALCALLLAAPSISGAKEVAIPIGTPAPTPAPGPAPLRWKSVKVSTLSQYLQPTNAPGSGPIMEAAVAAPPALSQPEDIAPGLPGAVEPSDAAAGRAAAAEAVTETSTSNTPVPKNAKSAIYKPYGLTYDEARKELWVGDYRLHALYRVDPTTGAETRVVQGNSVVDGFNSMPSPYHLGLVRQGERRGDVLVASATSGRPIRIVDLHNSATRGNVTTLAGGVSYGYREGKGRIAWFRGMTDFAMLPGDSTYVYMNDYANHCLRKLNTVTTQTYAVFGRCGSAGYIASTGTNARMYYPAGLTNGKTKDELYVTERNNHIIRAVNVTSRTGSILAGRRGVSTTRDGGPGVGSLRYPFGMARYGDVLFIVTDLSTRLVVFSLSTKHIRSVLSANGGFRDGTLTQMSFNRIDFPAAVSESTVYISDHGNNAIRRVDFDWEAGVDMTVPGSAFPEYAGSSAAGVATVAALLSAVAAAVL